ncbi:hypothetical protein A7985_16415 [Pseudoalteromonas luteoviolacea]|uniref:Uncharacterized protein n=1 Tax=Pseudoalteromonas luteoviolacea TaxID=43657 RepID=A0A1C0TP12_9GAMM|nr:hypothetical protein A7985_16415 [Pseudoalteromonas luteoviolacea]
MQRQDELVCAASTRLLKRSLRWPFLLFREKRPLGGEIDDKSEAKWVHQFTAAREIRFSAKPVRFKKCIVA